MPSFVPRVNNFFSFRESFFAATVSRFSQGARSVYAPLCFRSQQLFFPFRETFVSPWSQVVFFNREENLCSPSLQESIVIFVSAKILFACVSVNRFPLSRRGKLP